MCGGLQAPFDPLNRRLDINIQELDEGFLIIASRGPVSYSTFAEKHIGNDTLYWVSGKLGQLRGALDKKQAEFDKLAATREQHNRTRVSPGFEDMGIIGAGTLPSADYGTVTRAGVEQPIQPAPDYPTPVAEEILPTPPEAPLPTVEDQEAGRTHNPFDEPGNSPIG